MFSSIWLPNLFKLIRPTGDDLKITHYNKSGKRYTYKSSWIARREALSEIINSVLNATQEVALFTGGIYAALYLHDKF